MIPFSISIFLSAFLLFQIQPMIGKFILPWFGGTPAVWSTLMLFFQVLLTGGYAYAYWLIGHVKQNRQIIIHLSLIAFAILVLILLSFTWTSPITPGSTWKPKDVTSPVLDIFKLLLVSVGLPYFILASNGPLMQAWFTRIFPDRSYARLYALSNVGSLLGLLVYPILIEPTLSLRLQGWMWSLGFILFGFLAGWVALQSGRATPRAQPIVDSNFRPERRAENFSRSPQSKDKLTDTTALRLRSPESSLRSARADYALMSLWIALSATASLFLLSVTNQISQEVAVIPFLWILPLTLYLLSFILSFSGERGYNRKFYVLLFTLSVALTLFVMLNATSLHVYWQIIAYCLLLFSVCMLCHGELYLLRPSSEHLTTFYLMISIGGAFGGIFVSLIAPLIFNGYWEFFVGLAMAIAILLTVMRGKRPVTLPKEHRDDVSDSAGSLLSGVRDSHLHWRAAQVSVAEERSLIVTQNITARARFVFVVFALVTGMLALISTFFSGALYSKRNFYGVIRVSRIVPDGSTELANVMSHGITVHGLQFLLDVKSSHIPTTYYVPNAGAGLAILNHPKYERSMRVGLLGLGVGTLVSYAQPGDVYRLYEINPVVIDLAAGAGDYFSFLSDSKADITVVPGDARISLEREFAQGQPQNFDVLVLDTFSSDSIPVHLVTKEAFALYLEHLASDGIIAAHITNLHLDLQPVFWKLAQYYGLSMVRINYPGDSNGGYASHWILLSRDPALFEIPAIQNRTVDLDGYSTNLKLWTDDYSNLFQILK